MTSRFKDYTNDDFFKAILMLETVDECYAFFEDVCTVAEMKALAQRFHVARLLDQGKTYTEITEEANVSTATISRVKRALDYGANGYKGILEKIKEAK